MDENACLLARSDLIVREEGDEGEALIFDPETERVKVLNHTGLTLWRWCETGHTPQDLVRRLSEEYDSVDLDVLRQDVNDFVRELLALGYLESMDTA
jgi:hypothetical protein